jgi:O-6-methylguanine DNA methyltransferase
MTSDIRQIRLPTPMGDLVAVASPRGLCGLEFVDCDRFALWRDRLAATLAENDWGRGGGVVLEAVRTWVHRYFAGEKQLPKVALDLRGTAFEVRVWRALGRLAPASTITYGGLARRIGLPRGARAVGGAVGRNPVSLIVPCHRVLAQGGLGGYGGGLDRKRWLLAHEQRHWGPSR